MRTPGSPDVLEYRRRLAVQRVVAGDSTHQVAEFLGVDPSSVRRWLTAFRQQGAEGLRAQPVSGRPPKLTGAQEKIVRRWLAETPTVHGFATDLWSTPRLATLIAHEFGISLHPDYLVTWLRQRGFSPQKPRRPHREHNAAAVAHWLATDWPRIKKKPAAVARRCGCWMKAGC